MQHAALVSEVNGAGQDGDDLGRLARRLRRARQLLRQAAALDVFQRQIGALRLDPADFVDLHNVRMLEAGERFALALEALQQVRPGVSAGGIILRATTRLSLRWRAL